MPSGYRPPPAGFVDLCLIDEYNQLQAHIFTKSKTGTHKAELAVGSLRLLIESAKQLIVLDNDLTTFQVKTLQRLRGDRLSQSVVLQNTYKPWTGVSCEYLNSWTSHRVLEKALLDDLTAQQEHRSNGDEWHGLVVACHSIQQVNLLKEQAIRLGVPANLIKVYTGETDDQVKQGDFANAKVAWEGMALILYTCTVSVGVDCDSDHFSRLYAFFNPSNAHAAQSAQMLFRARRLNSIRIAFAGANHLYLPSEPELLYKCVLKSHSALSVPISCNPHYSALEVPSLDEKALEEMTQTTFVGGMWLSYHMEACRSRRNFLYRLFSILGRAGIQPVRFIYEKDSEEERREAKAARDDLVSDLDLRNAEMAVAHLSAVRGLRVQQRQAQTLNRGEKLALKALQAAEMYNVDASLLTPEWVTHYLPFKDCFALLSKLSAGEWQRQFDAKAAPQPQLVRNDVLLERAVVIPTPTRASLAAGRVGGLEGTSQLEQMRFVVRILNALGVTLVSNEQVIQPLTLVSPDLLSVLKDLLGDVKGKSCPATRVFGGVFTNPKSTNDWRVHLAGAMEDVKPKRIVNLVNKPLSVIGAVLKPVGDRDDRYYVFMWLWLGGPGPVPTHPLPLRTIPADSDSDFQSPDSDSDGGSVVRSLRRANHGGSVVRSSASSSSSSSSSARVSGRPRAKAPSPDSDSDLKFISPPAPLFLSKPASATSLSKPAAGLPTSSDSDDSDEPLQVLKLKRPKRSRRGRGDNPFKTNNNNKKPRNY